MKELPAQGFVFWPVGNGDSTTIVIRKSEVVMQVDLHHLEKSDDSDEPHTPIVDELVRLLPQKDGNPYLSVFALTHPDMDHILGFRELLKKVTIGEIWHTPRIFQEYQPDLCDDAKKFCEEVTRRRDITIANGGQVVAGDRVRIIGHDESLIDPSYENFPEEWHSYPGTSIIDVDGEDCSEVFEAFVHAPFVDDSAAERNDTSLALQIVLRAGDSAGKALLFGDRGYATIKQIFDVTKAHHREQYLEWDVLLSAHHCSKKVMYWPNENGEEELKQDMMKDLEAAQLPECYVIASSNSDFSDEEGKNPPHLKARNRYEEIVDDGHFVCTHEHPNIGYPEAIVFELRDSGLELTDVPAESDGEEGLSRAAAAVAGARGGDAPPQQQVGFGNVPRKG